MYDPTRMLPMVRSTDVRLCTPPVPGITIDAYAPEDWPAFIALDLEAAIASGAVRTGHDAGSSLQAWILERRGDFEETPVGPATTGYAIRLARSADHVVLGEMILSGDDPLSSVVKIASISVRADHRRQGIGALLVQDAVAFARANAIRWLSIDVEKANQVARMFYAKLGFTQR
jgi:ribosomal protein S18 acetylase RimI-like enzyme